MATAIQTWQIRDAKLVAVGSSLPANGKREGDLEKWIRSDPGVLGQDIVIIGEQVQASSGPMDFLGIDTNGNAVIVELKRDTAAREALVQAIDYASDVAEWEGDRFKEICRAYTNQNMEELLQAKFEGIAVEDLAINQAQRLLLVGFSIEDSLARMIDWLSDKYNVGINAIMLSYSRTSQGDEILSRVVMIPEEIERQKRNRNKFIIEMSDEPGAYEEATLEAKLVEYLSSSLVSSQRIRDHLLPILLERGQMTRDQLKKEFVRRGAARDESQAGYFLSLISSQLGHKWKDYLRQVVHYEYPNHPWEKDGFRIEDAYVTLVRRALAQAGTHTTL